MNFENKQYHSESLPKVSNLKMEALSPAFLKKWLLERLILTLFLALCFSFAFFLAQDELLEILDYIFLSYLILSLIFVLWPKWAFQFRSYAIREHDIIYQKGMIWRQKTALPYNRIQHLELKQGPLEKKFKLKSIKFYTAGGDSGDLSIEGLNEEEAESLKSFISERISIAI